MANISFRLRKNSLMEQSFWGAWNKFYFISTTLIWNSKAAEKKLSLVQWQSTLMSVFYLPLPLPVICKTPLLSRQNLRVLCPLLTSQFSFAKLSRLPGIFTVFPLSSPHSTIRDWPLAIKPAFHLLYLQGNLFAHHDTPFLFTLHNKTSRGTELQV